MLAKTIDHLSRKMYHARQIFAQFIQKWLVEDRFGTGYRSGAGMASITLSLLGSGVALSQETAHLLKSLVRQEWPRPHFTDE